jgi:hypothetical protein
MFFCEDEENIHTFVVGRPTSKLTSLIVPSTMLTYRLYLFSSHEDVHFKDFVRTMTKLHRCIASTTRKLK